MDGRKRAHGDELVFGEYGPSGEHLVVLARHSQEVLKTVLGFMDRQDLLVAHEILEIERRIARLTAFVEKIKSRSPVP
jgi:hypothetical protein